MLRAVAQACGEWAGIPMPLEGERLIIEPRYPHAKALMKMGAAAKDDDADDTKWLTENGFDGATIVNRFWSHQRSSTIVIIRKVDGTTTWGLDAGVNHFKFDLAALGCADAWGLEQESNAVKLLATLVRHRQLKQYMLTGMFMEQSRRSGLHYVFRRLRPTVVLHNVRPGSFLAGRRSGMCILSTLCLHPIGYYAGSWGGAMTPTDDVVAHLSLMRADEHMLWRRANQHPAWRPESGL